MNLQQHKDDVNFCNGWSNLKDYGIASLTGEACAYSQRLLCDLSEDGENLIRHFFSLPDGTKFNKNWNSRVGDKPAISSIMLPYSLLDDLRVFILFHIEHKTYAVWFPGDNMTGTDVQIDRDELDKRVKVKANYAKLGNHPNSGGRNVHQMSGRID